MAVLLREMARMLTVVLSLNRNSEGGHACAFLFGWLENSHGCKMLPLRGAEAIQKKKNKNCSACNDVLECGVTFENIRIF